MTLKPKSGHSPIFNLTGLEVKVKDDTVESMEIISRHANLAFCIHGSFPQRCPGVVVHPMEISMYGRKKVDFGKRLCTASSPHVFIFGFLMRHGKKSTLAIDMNVFSGTVHSMMDAKTGRILQRSISFPEFSSPVELDMKFRLLGSVWEWGNGGIR